MTTPKKTSQEDFFIADAQNEGVVIPLFRPDGSKSEHWLKLLGHFSNAFQKARRELFKSAKSVAETVKTQAEIDALVDQRRLQLTAVLIKDWSFDQECTQENIVAFLEKAPQIAAMVDSVAGDQVLFTTNASRSSRRGSTPRSNSKPRSKVRHTRSKRT